MSLSLLPCLIGLGGVRVLGALSGGSVLSILSAPASPTTVQVCFAALCVLFILSLIYTPVDPDPTPQRP